MWQLTLALTVLVATVVVTEANSFPQVCDRCACNSACIDNSYCVCNASHSGDPTFHCYGQNNSYCHIKSDPMLRTFSGQHFKLRNSGTYLLVNTTLDRLARGGGKCDIVINVTLATIAGRIYANELEFELVQRSNNRTLTFRVRVKAYIVGTDVFAWDIYYLNKGDDNNPWIKIRSDDPFIVKRTVSATNCEIEFLSYHSRFLKIRLYCCGILFAIRQQSNISSLVPGVFLELDSDNNPVLTPNDGSLCERTF